MTTAERTQHEPERQGHKPPAAVLQRYARTRAAWEGSGDWTGGFPHTQANRTGMIVVSVVGSLVVLSGWWQLDPIAAQSSDVMLVWFVRIFASCLLLALALCGYMAITNPYIGWHPGETIRLGAERFQAASASGARLNLPLTHVSGLVLVNYRTKSNAGGGVDRLHVYLVLTNPADELVHALETWCRGHLPERGHWITGPDEIGEECQAKDVSHLAVYRQGTTVVIHLPPNIKPPRSQKTEWFAAAQHWAQATGLPYETCDGNGIRYGMHSDFFVKLVVPMLGAFSHTNATKPMVRK